MASTKDSPAAKTRFQRVSESTQRFVLYVIMYNWLFALTVLPLAVCMVALLSHSASIRVSHVIVAGYIFHEITAFVTERNWSRVSFLRFWGYAAPFAVIHALLCLLLVPGDALGCLLFGAICMGAREFLFEVGYSSPKVSGYDLRERLIVSLTTAFVYCVGVVSLAAATYTLVRAVQYKERRVSPLVLGVLFVAILPPARFLSRLLFTQVAAGAALAPEPLGQSPDSGASGGAVLPLVGERGALRPQLDTLVLYADVILALTMYLEFGFAFLLLIAPHIIIFAIALSVGVLFDILFVCCLGTLQWRRLAGRPERRSQEEVGLGNWSPTYCVSRQRSLLSTLMTRAMTRAQQNPEERTPIRAGEADKDATKDISAGTFSSVGSAEAADAGAMSPRVTHFLDEYDHAVIECRSQQKGRRTNGQGNLAVYLYQERKITFSAHLLGNTVTLVLAAATAVMLFHSRDLKFHDFDWKELWWRIATLALVRIMTDYISCWSMEATSSEVQLEGRSLLWESRYEFATPHGWLFGALVALCPMFAVLAATV